MKLRSETFVWKDACYEIRSDRPDLVRAAVIRLRALLEDYIRRRPEFRTSFAPIPILPDAPPIARRMHAAARATGVGPMAAVAGAMAQEAAESAIGEGAREVLVNNGGDVFVSCRRDIVIGIHPGAGHPLENRLAFRVTRREQPVAVCTSSGRMGHSLSLGCCDAAVVVARDAALADAAATMAANRVGAVTKEAVREAAEAAVAVEGVDGALIVAGPLAATAGKLPEIVPVRGADIGGRVLVHPGAFRGWR